MRELWNLQMIGAFKTGAGKMYVMCSCVCACPHMFPPQDLYVS